MLKVMSKIVFADFPDSPDFPDIPDIADIAKRSRNGFSLVELLIVVGITAVLGSIATSIYSGWKENVARNQAKAHLTSLYSAEAIFFAEWNQYFADFNELGFRPEGNTQSSIRFAQGSGPAAGISTPSNYTGGLGANTPPVLFYAPNRVNPDRLVGVGEYTKFCASDSSFAADNPASIDPGCPVVLEAESRAMRATFGARAFLPIDRRTRLVELWSIRQNKQICMARYTTPAIACSLQP